MGRGEEVVRCGERRKNWSIFNRYKHLLANRMSLYPPNYHDQTQHTESHLHTFGYKSISNHLLLLFGHEISSNRWFLEKRVCSTIICIEERIRFYQIQISQTAPVPTTFKFQILVSNKTSLECSKASEWYLTVSPIFTIWFWELFLVSCLPSVNVNWNYEWCRGRGSLHTGQEDPRYLGDSADCRSKH